MRRSLALVTTLLAGGNPVSAQVDMTPEIVADYDTGTAYVLQGRTASSVARAIPGMQASWVFNRALRWKDAADLGADGLLCHAVGGDLALTGQGSVSRWYAEAPDSIEEGQEGLARCRKLATSRAWAQFALPPLQFHRGQHPVLVLEVMSSSHPWRLLAFPKGRSGRPLHLGSIRTGGGIETVAVADLLAAHGYTSDFAQLQLVVVVETPSNATTAELVMRARLTARAALVAGLPVIRSEGSPDPVTLLALPLGASGDPLPPEDLAVRAVIDGHDLALQRLPSGAWSAPAPALPRGRHDALITATWPGGSATTRQVVVITDGLRTTYDPARRSLVRGGVPLGPQSGSYRGQPMFSDPGRTGERLVQGQQAWDAVKGTIHRGQFGNWGGPRYGFHAWEALTDRELDADYAYLRQCGWDVVHLTQGWWIWDRWDADGRLAPVAAEQLARTLAAGQHHGLRFYLAPSHYPYGYWSEPSAGYLEAGYTGYQNRAASPQLSDPASPFWTLYGNYLRQLLAFLADATPVSLMSSSGEGDRAMPAAFLTLSKAIIDASGLAPVLVTEDRDLGWPGSLAGYRTYSIDRPSNSLEDLAAWFDANVGDRRFMAEGGFWGYSGGAENTDAYRRKIRQMIYAGLARRMPAMLTWEERVTEDERRVLAEARRLVDWNTNWRPGIVDVSTWLTLPSGWRGQASLAEDARTGIAFLTRTASGPDAMAELRLGTSSGNRIITAWDLAAKAPLARDVPGPVGARVPLPSAATEVLVVLRPDPGPEEAASVAIVAPANQSTPVDTPTIPLAVEVVTIGLGANEVIVSANSSDTTIVPTSGLVLTGSGSTRSLVVHPSRGRTGSTEITLTATAAGLMATARFGVEVGSGTPSRVRIRAGSTSIPEGDSLAVEVLVEPAVSVPVAVELAATGAPVSIRPSTVVVPAGSGAASAIVTALDDELWSGDRAASIAVVAVSGGGLAIEDGEPSLAVLVVEDEPPPPLVTLAASAGAFAEASGVVTVTASLPAPLASDVRVELAWDGTATENIDASLGASALVIPAGATSTSTSLSGLQDALVEGPEIVRLALASVSGSGAAIGPNDRVDVTILDDEPPPPGINVDFGSASSALYAGRGPAAGSGPVAAGTETWNRVASPSSTALLSTSGATTGVGVSVAGHTGFYDGAGPAGTAQAVTRDYVYAIGVDSMMTVTLSGLEAGGSVDLWVIGAAGQYSGYGCAVTVAGETRQSSWNPPENNAWIEGRNFAHFPAVIADTQGRIVLQVRPNAVKGDEADLAGMQLRPLGPPALPIPGSLSAAPGSGGGIALSWDAVGAPATGLRLERANSPRGPFVTIANRGATAGTWLDETVEPGTTRHYRLKSTNARAESWASTTVPGRAYSRLESWRIVHWGSPDAVTGSADSDDADGDGIPNRVEFVLGTSPRDAGDRVEPRLALDSSSPGSNLVVSFTPAEVEGVTLVLERSSDLATWEPAADLTSRARAGQPVQHVEPLPAAESGPVFLRLRLNLPP